MRWLKKLARSAEPVPARGKEGSRAYAVGDIHGRLDLLDETLAMIEADARRSAGKPGFLVFLGDLIDRGPDSAGVVERLRTYRHPHLRTIFLMGNHEEFLLRVLSGEHGLLDDWFRYGGRECMESYGADVRRLVAVEEDVALATVRERVPAAHRTFLESFHDSFRFGDYLFVHAGIRPGRPLERQSPQDLRWMREPFLSDRTDHGFVVVHGHTISDSVDERANRIGIDTGAYGSGRLTTLVIEDGERRFLQTGG